MARDYYDIMGVDKDADADTLKKAYRRLARKYHPDRNQDDANAEANFKEMKEAYDVLSDPAKRATYDQFGTTEVNSPGGFGGHTASSMSFEEMLARMRAQGIDTSAYERRETIQRISVPVDIMINGGKTQFRYMNQQGSGSMFSFNHSIGEMTLRPNTKVGAQIKSPNVPNTVFVMVPQGHRRCDVQGLDLVVPMRVNALAAAIGSKATVTHPNGKTYEVTIPVGTENGVGVRLAKLGLQHVNGAVGNLIAVVNYYVPKLDRETQDALRKLLEDA